MKREKSEKEKLLDLKSKIETSKIEQSEQKGTYKHLMKELQEKWGCETIEQAKKKLNGFDKDIETLDDSFEKGMEELEEKYNFEDNELV